MQITNTQSTHLVWRSAGAVGLFAIAAIHAADVSGKMSETPYLGWMYLGLIAASIATAAALLSGRQHRAAWIATAGLAASTFIGYCLSRTTGLPGAMGDIGNWGETLGVASLAVETTVVVLALACLRSVSMTRNGRGITTAQLAE